MHHVCDDCREHRGIDPCYEASCPKVRGILVNISRQMDTILDDYATDKEILQYMLDKAGITRSDALDRLHGHMLDGNMNNQRLIDSFFFGIKRSRERLEEPRGKKRRTPE